MTRAVVPSGVRFARPEGPDGRSALAVLCAVAIAVALAGCAGGMRSAPAWIDGAPPAEYPERQYVSAVATGPGLSAAQSAAKAELSREFSARVRDEIDLTDRETVAEGMVEQSSELLNRTRIETDLELQGVEVPLHWRDPRTGDVWALAVLERNKECLRIRSEGRDLITELDAKVAEARAATNPLLGLRASLAAVALGTQLDGLQARSRVLGSQCLTGRSVSTGTLKSDAAARLGRLRFVVSAEDVDPRSGRVVGTLPQLREQIAGLLTRMGFQVGPASGATAIPIEARLRLSRVERGTDWIEYRWEGAAEVGSPVPGDPAIIAAESEGAESHPEASTARLRARRKGEQDLARKLETRLQAFLDEGAPDSR